MNCFESTGVACWSGRFGDLAFRCSQNLHQYLAHSNRCRSSPYLPKARHQQALNLEASHLFKNVLQGFFGVLGIAMPHDGVTLTVTKRFCKVSLGKVPKDHMLQDKVLPIGCW